MPFDRAFVIGHPIGHSRSPLLHGHWLATLGLSGSYEAVDLAQSEIDGFFARLDAEGWVGGNVTVPHKTSVARHLAEIDAAAQAIGAVNTIWRENGRLVGGNTDALGFVAHLDEAAPGWDAQAGLALVLGAGGAARAAIHGLLERGFDIVLANRTLERAGELARHFGPRVAACDWRDLAARLPQADVLVNTTALGMHGQPPLSLDLSGLKPSAVAYDIVYAPLETAFLRAARARGHRAVDGLGMLLHQAAPGFKRWFGVAPKVTRELRALIEADIRAKSG